MPASGVKFTAADPACVAAIKARTAGLQHNWAKAAQAKGLKGASTVSADDRAEITRLEK